MSDCPNVPLLTSGIDCTAMRTDTLGMELHPTIATTEMGTGKAEIAAKGKHDIGYEERITYII